MFGFFKKKNNKHIENGDWRYRNTFAYIPVHVWDGDDYRVIWFKFYAVRERATILYGAGERKVYWDYTGRYYHSNKQVFDNFA